MAMLNGDIYEALLEGLGVTLQVTFLAVLWGTVVAVVLGVASLSGNVVVRAAVRAYVELFRGVSAIILLFWAYFALPLFGVDLSPLQAGVLALGLNLSAYGAEIVRGAVKAVPKGQTEASVALNLSAPRRIWSVVLPQAAVIMLPTYGSLLIEVMKASSLVSLIDLSDITNRASNLRRGNDFESVDIFVAVLVIYFGISLCITGVVRLLERYFGRGLDLSRTGGGAVVK